MTAEPKVSVIIPTFNDGELIEDCLSSLQGQGVEIICVDALSKDSTLDVLEEQERESSVKLLYAKKRSLGYQLNLGLEAAEGEYVAFLYPNCRASKGAYKKLVVAARKDRLDFLQAEIRSLDNIAEENEKEPWHLSAAIFRREFLLGENISLPELPGKADPQKEFYAALATKPHRSCQLQENWFVQVVEKQAGTKSEAEEVVHFAPISQSGSEFIFPFHLFPRGARVVIYGAEEISYEFFRQGRDSGYAIPVAIIDSSEVLQRELDGRLVDQELLYSLNFDYVLLSNLDYTTAQNQKAYLIRRGLKPSYIKWHGEAYRRLDWQKNFYLPLLDNLRSFRRPHGEEEIELAAIARPFPRQQEKKYIFVDLSFISKVDFHTGVQRVVNNVYAQMKSLGTDFEIVPTQYREGGLFTCYAYEARGTEANPEEMQVELSAGDILFFLDSVWDYWRDMEKLMKLAHKAGARCVALFHDLIPIRHPEYLPEGGSDANFRRFTALCASYMDRCLCDSKATASDLRSYFEEQNFLREEPLAIHWIPMGSVFGQNKAEDGNVRKELQDFLKGETYLMVGTVEVRKNCELVLAAMEEAIQKQDFAGRLLVIGKNGWRNDAFQKVFERLTGTGRILWLQDADDAELNYAYRHAKALVNASKAEGFGLPLIEAAKEKLPLIVSDIPIFHEVAGSCALYFDNTNHHELAKILAGFNKRKKIPDSSKIRRYKWEDTAKSCLEIFRGRKKPYLIYGQKTKTQRVLYDVSNIIIYDGGTGIQRSVKEVYRALCVNPEYQVVPCDFKTGRTAYRFHEYVFDLPQGLPEAEISIESGDRLFFMDACWDEHAKLREVMLKAKDIGAKVYVFFHDLIPLRHSELLSDKFDPGNFRAWTELSLHLADGIIGNSLATISDVKSYQNEVKIARSLDFGCMHFGFQLPKEERGDIRPKLDKFLSQGKIFLMVGTLEVRKDHLTALRALELLHYDSEAKILIIGHEGWGNDEVKKKIEEVNKDAERVLWLSDASDGELQYAYHHAFALIQASITEGFGLPLIEAGYYRLPIICTDIPVFREVTEGIADYFPVGDERSLAKIMERYLDDGAPKQKDLHLYTWQDTAKEMLEACFKEAEK